MSFRKVKWHNQSYATAANTSGAAPLLMPTPLPISPSRRQVTRKTVSDMQQACQKKLEEMQARLTEQVTSPPHTLPPSRPLPPESSCLSPPLSIHSPSRWSHPPLLLPLALHSSCCSPPLSTTPSTSGRVLPRWELAFPALQHTFLCISCRIPLLIISTSLPLHAHPTTSPLTPHHHLLPPPTPTPTSTVPSLASYLLALNSHLLSLSCPLPPLLSPFLPPLSLSILPLRPCRPGAEAAALASG